MIDQNIPFVYGVELKREDGHTDQDFTEKAAQSIQMLSSMASSCSGSHVLISEGTFPSETMARDLAYASTILNALAKELANQIESTTLQV